MAPRQRKNDDFYDNVKQSSHIYEASRIAQMLQQVDQARVESLSSFLARYIRTNLPNAIDQRQGLASYRTNPYVLLASASVMRLTNASRFADFLFNNKLYMGLETSFGKSIELIPDLYPIGANTQSRWEAPQEKVAEFAALNGLSRTEKARARNQSVWREIDKSCVVGSKRYLVTIKSGPNTINDTQVEAMRSAIANHHKTWMQVTREHYSDVTSLDIIIGLTYGTDRTTNNKENQILVKLLEAGFVEEDAVGSPGVLIDEDTRSIRVYRSIGQQFWALIGNPTNPSTASFVYLEVLLGLAHALSREDTLTTLEDRVNLRVAQLSVALGNLIFPRNSLPEWIAEDFSEDALFWLATAMTAFFDEGI